MNAQAAAGDGRITLERSGWRDTLRVWRAQRAMFGPDAYDLLTLLGLALNPLMLRFKAVSGGEVVGFIASEISWRDGAAWIIIVGTHPRHWGRGIATALIDEVARTMSPRAPRLKLTVRRGNTRAIRLYEHLGFREVSVARHYYHDGEDGLIMERPLASAAARSSL